MGIGTRWNLLFFEYLSSAPLLDTVKASNFGPHGNFGLFLTSFVASVDESCTKNERNRICRSEVFLQLLFSSLFCRTRFNDGKPFWKRGPKYPWGPMLGALTVIVSTEKEFIDAYTEGVKSIKFRIAPSGGLCSAPPTPWSPGWASPRGSFAPSPRVAPSSPTGRGPLWFGWSLGSCSSGSSDCKETQSSRWSHRLRIGKSEVIYISWMTHAQLCSRRKKDLCVIRETLRSFDTYRIFVLGSAISFTRHKQKRNKMVIISTDYRYGGVSRTGQSWERAILLVDRELRDLGKNVLGSTTYL